MNSNNTKELSELITNLKKSKIYASASKDFGKYNFYICSNYHKYIDKFQHNFPSILISTGGEFYTHYAKNNYSFSTDVWGIQIKDKKVNDKYVYYFLENKRELINYKGFQGSGLKHLDKNYLKQQRINIPHIKKQEKIVNFLTCFDQFIQKLKNKIIKLEYIQKTLLDSFFNEDFNSSVPKENNNNLKKKWKIKKLQEVCTLKRGKFSHRPRNDPRFYGGDIPFIQTGDVSKENIEIFNYKQTLNQNGLKVSKLFKKGTLVITIAANIGDVGILQFDSCFPDSLVAITPVNKTETDITFIFFFFKNYKRVLNNIASKSTQKNINLDLLNDIKIHLPPFKDQKKISSILLKNYQNIELHKRKLNKIKILKKTYMLEIFNNE